ncbi:MAG: glutamate--tRNA ligase [Candidatus Korobacteraceae bacterium]
MSNSSQVRVRFAPSPTGHLHVGNARTALFNWLFARQAGGVMVLRIEDTDVERSEARFEGQLLDDLKWMGLDWDEGPDVGGAYAPYRQSDRLAIYHEQSERLLSEGKAYLCFCSQEELERDRAEKLANQLPPIYLGKCRALDPAEAQRRRASGEAAAIRLRIPEHPIRFHDIVHGAVEFSNEVVSDPIILRSTGIPVYNYVVVVDDALMKITHVIRGDDHLSNTPKQVALYEALGWPVPEFAHLSTILGSDRERLSKRHGATSIANFREMGVLPEALMNYLALLGWAPSGGTREIFTPEELKKEFSLERVTPSPAVFDMEKLYWLNRHYMKESAKSLPDAERRLEQEVQAGYIARIDALAEITAAIPKLQRIIVDGWKHFENAGWLPNQDEASGTVLLWYLKMVELFLPSVDKLEQLPERAALIFSYDAAAAVSSPENAEVLAAPKTNEVLEEFAKLVDDSRPGLEQRETRGTQLITAERFKAIMNEVKAKTGAKGKDLFHPVRIALTGSHSGPEFDKLIPILEEGSELELPKHVMGVRERVWAFRQAHSFEKTE